VTALPALMLLASEALNVAYVGLAWAETATSRAQAAPNVASSRPRRKAADLDEISTLPRFQ
jgi:hypothetical protein